MRHAFKVLISVFALAALGMSVAASGALAHPGHKHPATLRHGARRQPDPRGFSGQVLQPEGQVRQASTRSGPRAPTARSTSAARTARTRPPPGAYSSEQTRSVNELQRQRRSLPSTPRGRHV